MPVPTYPLYTAVLAKIGARAGVLSHRSGERLAARPRRTSAPDHARDPGAGRDRPEQSDRRLVSARRAARRWSTSPTSTTFRCWPTRSTPTSRSTVRVGAIAAAQSGRAGHHLLVVVEGLPGARLAGRLAGGRADTDGWTRCCRAVKKLADGRLCATGPMEYAITAALNGDRSHQETFRAALRARADVTTARLNAIDGISRRRPVGGVLRDAAGWRCRPAAPTRITCSGCCARPACSASTAPASAPAPEDGFFRIVFLAVPGRSSARSTTTSPASRRSSCRARGTKQRAAGRRRPRRSRSISGRSG